MERLLGIDPGVARQINHREQQIAEFLVNPVLRFGQRVLTLFEFLANFRGDGLDGFPVEANSRGPFANFLRSK